MVPADRALFRRVKDALFAGRRKTVINNLKRCSDIGVSDTHTAAQLLQRCAIDPGTRAEQLSPETFIRLADALYQLQQTRLR